ncbi:PAAR domain-containing protein [Swingsia samuiensis]|nr:PAAR domain-containing protein [Swingsia samuiensis]
MGKPAARITDMHICPETTGTVPHVGGPIIKGSDNVFINGLPAARIGDNLICHGPMDIIAAGSPTVLINGKPAARMGDQTAHGGVIIKGSSNVIIGDGGNFGNNIIGTPCPKKAASSGAPFYDPS